MIPDYPRCGMCGRPLGKPGVRTSIDCGGDCWGCIRDIETWAEPEGQHADSNLAWAYVAMGPNEQRRGIVER